MSGASPDLAVVQNRLSSERLGPYLAAANGDLAEALDLYAWNSDLASCLAVTLGHVEIVLRNAIHENLTDWSTRQFGEPRWYLDPGRVFRERARLTIRVAQDRAARHPGVQTPGRVVAELSIGFWRRLLTSDYDRTLWRYTLFRAFPGQRRRRAVHDAAEVVHLCRNRLAHHEPIFNKPVAHIHSTALVLTDWICPVSKVWVERQCLTLDMLLQGPRPRFRPAPGTWQSLLCDTSPDAGEPPR